VTTQEYRSASFFSQFGFPRGRMGHVAGVIMALENRAANRLVVDLARLREGDYVLEVGCGPGVALLQAASRARFAVGVDPSEVMTAQARRRCRTAIRKQRAQVDRASAAHLPYDDAFFTCALAIHSTHHWPCLKDGLHELHRVLEPGARCLLAGRIQRSGRDPHANGASDEQLASFVTLLSETGFAAIERTNHALRRETLAIFHAHTARRP
jgi:ubiquinone/menaquinone biosynthesis C-methylase UbiE